MCEGEGMSMMKSDYATCKKSNGKTSSDCGSYALIYCEYYGDEIDIDKECVECEHYEKHELEKERV